MMEWTDRHCRYFLRLISRATFLYTEMVTAEAVLYGNRERVLGFPLELGADSFAEVLGRVDPVTVEPELADPVGEPLDEVIARRARVSRAFEEGVELP